MSASDTYHHGHLRSALLQEASSVLEGSGARSISMRDLARRLGVSHAAPRHHFPDRHALLSALAADGFEMLADALEAAMAGPPDSWQTRTGRAYVRFAVDHPERYRLMFTTRINSGDCEERLAHHSHRAYMALLKAVYGEGLAEIDPAHYRLGAPELQAWSLVHGAVMLWIDGQLDAATTEAEFLELVDDITADPG
ncbi:MAG: TetR/AcrR family transcriptional regulator [Actinomycetota bacterium]